MLRVAALLARELGGSWGWRCYRRRRCALRSAASHRQPEASDWRGHRQHSRYFRRLSLQPRYPRQHRTGSHSAFPSIICHVADVLRRLDRRSEQRGPAQSFALGGILEAEKQGKRSSKILDTSVIIDGRIADIAETGFLDGIVVIPQFVLRELQLVADSSDSLKRNRGRRGLDILQRIQKMATLNVQIVEDDFPAVREVDLKLIELAKALRMQDRHQRLQSEQSCPTPGCGSPQHQRAGQFA